MSNKKKDDKEVGLLKSYVRWPLYLTFIMLTCTLINFFVSYTAGIVSAVFMLVYIGAAVIIYYKKAPDVLAS